MRRDELEKVQLQMGWIIAVIFLQFHLTKSGYVSREYSFVTSTCQLKMT